MDKPKEGHPTLYSDKMQSESEDYLDSCESNKELPTVYGLALRLKVHKDTLYEWAKVHKEFSVTLERLSNMQAQMLILKGLANEYNSTIAKLMLSSNHGMKERTDQTTNDKDLPAPLLGGQAKDSV